MSSCSFFDSKIRKFFECQKALSCQQPCLPTLSGSCTPGSITTRSPCRKDWDLVSSSLSNRCRSSAERWKNKSTRRKLRWLRTSPPPLTSGSGLIRDESCLSLHNFQFQGAFLYLKCLRCHPANRFRFTNIRIYPRSFFVLSYRSAGAPISLIFRW